VTDEEWNLVKDDDVNVRRAEASDAMRAVRAEVANKDARLMVFLVSGCAVNFDRVEEEERGAEVI
jgi:hypothetical protein